MKFNWRNDTRLAEPLRVTRVVLEREGNGLILSLRLRNDSDASEVELIFLDVTDLRFRSTTIELTGLVLLQFEDIRKNGWEGIHFCVKDYEEEFILFYCRDIKEAASLD